MPVVQNAANNYIIERNNIISVISNVGTVSLLSNTNTFVNSSAAAMTITIPTTGAILDQVVTILIVDFTASAKAITWVNTENSSVSAPTLSNGVLNSPRTVQFIWNSLTSKWRCILNV